MTAASKAGGATSVRRLKRDRAELLTALETLVNTYIANRGTQHEFVKCITPKNIPDYWQKARATIAKMRS